MHMHIDLSCMSDARLTDLSVCMCVCVYSSHMQHQQICVCACMHVCVVCVCTRVTCITYEEEEMPCKLTYLLLPINKTYW